jgi:hypothetical protein
VATAAAPAAAVSDPTDGQATTPSAAADAATAVAAKPAPAPAPAPVKELNALALMWAVFKGWLAGLFGRKS